MDIGCGTGWFINYLKTNKYFKNIYGIEPSESAIKIARRIYPENEDINYLIGYAEDLLKTINLKGNPTLFTTFIVFSHLNDETVIKILSEMDKIAPKNSVLIFNENVGNVFAKNLWYCRPKEWWENNLSNWKLTFDERDRPDINNYKQGLKGIKIS